MEARELLRTLVLAALWAGFLGWCWLALQGPGAYEILGAGEMIFVVLRTYLAMLGGWVFVRRMVDRLGKSSRTAPFQEPVFTKDYFGREVALDAGASFADQHLVLEYSDGRKVYRSLKRRGAAGADASKSLRSLAAAAGQSTAPSVAHAVAEEPHV